MRYKNHSKCTRRDESLQTYDTNILYISQNLINTNNIYGTNITKARNIPLDFILNRLKTLKVFLASIEIFLYVTLLDMTNVMQSSDTATGV